MIVTFVLGLLLGLGLAYLCLRERIVKASKYESMQLEYVRLESACEAEKSKVQSMQLQMEHLNEYLGRQFKQISLELFKENASSFMQLAEEGIKKYTVETKEALNGQNLVFEKTLDPLKENLKDFSDKLERLEYNRVQSASSFKEHLEMLNKMQLRLESKTEILSRALCNSSTRGRWGEMQLRRVVEIAGMLEYVDFDVQCTLPNSLLRPDMVIHLPNNRTVIVDAKTPQWDQFLALSQDAKEESLAANELKNCCQRIRDLISKLGAKSYASFLDQSIDFVVLFFPGEWIFSRALELDKTLIEYACRYNVVFATPTTLIALLKAIYYGWRQNKMVEEVREIGVVGNELYERLLTLSNYLQDLRKNLGKTVDSYNQLLGSIESRILPSARKLNVFAKKNTNFELPAELDAKLKQNRGESEA